MSSDKLPKPVHNDPSKSAELCNQWVDSALTKNTAVQFLIKTLIDAGCHPPENFIRCVNCEQPAAGGFGMVLEEETKKNITAKPNQIPHEQCHPTMNDLQEKLQREKVGLTKLRLNPEIYICQQYMESELMTHRTVHHELIHAIDMCRTNMDPLRNCIHMACTEIRAENLSGECSFWKDLHRIKTLKGHGRECVKRRALLSVRANPNCTARAEDFVNAAFNRCNVDFYPYDRHPNEKD
jgi:mitochondrial inner membrane protease ATP23